MKNPFVKEKNNALIAGIIVGSVAAVVVTYLFTTKKGAAIRGDICDSLGRLHKSIFGGEEDNNQEDHSHDYMEKPHKTPKTDREALLKNQILTDSGTEG